MHYLRLCALFTASITVCAGMPVIVPDMAIQNEQSPVRENPEASADSQAVENWTVLGDIRTGLEPRPPFEVQRDEEESFTREFIRLEWRAGDPIDLWVMRPKAPSKVPVVLYLYSYPGDANRFRDNGWCTRVTQGGFAAVGFVSALTGQRYHNRPMKQWFISELAESLGSSVHDVQLILNYLGTRGDLDMDHVGMFGMGSGASIAILAAHADPRIKVLDLLDPWGDWPDWLQGSPAIPENERGKYTTQEFLKSVALLDPVIYLPQLKRKELRLQQVLSDQATPEKAKEKIAAAIPEGSVFVQYADAKEHRKAWQAGGLSGWIKQQLQAGKQTGLEKPQQ